LPYPLSAVWPTSALEVSPFSSLDPNSASQHAWATLVDQGANTSKVWWFGTEVGSYRGLAWQYEERNEAVPGSPLLRKEYGWAATGNGNVYVSSVVTTLDPGTQQAQTKTTQVVDNYGNVTQQQVYGWGNLSTPARTYDFTYLTDPTYTSRYIRNRLTLATVTPAGGTAAWLAFNEYDVYNWNGTPPLVERSARLHDNANFGAGFRYRGT
jgi:hypothetical protein